MDINIREMKFSHDEISKKALIDIELWTVDRGERIFVHGPSGAGKSTLLNLVSGLLSCSEGEISVLGERLDRLNSRQRDRFRANHLGYVFQRFNLVPYLSAIENIDLARSFLTRKDRLSNKLKAPELLDSLGLASDDWKKPVSRLSTGQQQRVAIARALVNTPEILIADEPTSSLDQQNRENFMSMLMQLVESKEMTLLFVSHDMSLTQYFTRVQALNDFSKTA
ncbi:MAG: ABC transporter ATP-binding protein [Euryarchaeota archaeon TMED255]|nr:MAG: ABC transporter ATP-binding protein [Euryarchaeota archaeon TMED255]